MLIIKSALYLMSVAVAALHTRQLRPGLTYHFERKLFFKLQNIKIQECASLGYPPQHNPADITSIKTLFGH